MASPTWILNRVALATHRRLLAETGGQSTQFEPVLLFQALGWPRSLLALSTSKVRLTDLAAAYSEAMLRLRPFVEGNERTAFALAMLFLHLNGVQWNAPATEKLMMFTGLAEGRLSREQISEWLSLRMLASRIPGGMPVVRVRMRQSKIVSVSALRRAAAPALGPTVERAALPDPGHAA